MAAESEGCRFASLNEEEMNELFNNVDSHNTKRATGTAIKAFRAYLTEKGLSADFENFNEVELDERLANFYCEMRNRKGQMYKKSTFISYRHGIQRHLEKCGKDMDIVNGTQFKKSNKAFKCMTKELKRQGLANVEHHPSIADQDLEVIYSYLCSDLEDAQHLQYKVFLDIMLHFGRRGRENLATLTRQDFAVQSNANGMLYVYKTKDEKTKNHQDDSEKSADGRMYEIKDSERCPVRSFVKYIRRLNPKCSRLFQQPRILPKDGIYYDNLPVGHNKLGSYMNDISKKSGINTIYTNHSCRATTVHVLDSAHIPSRHIMTVTGHRSESSLKTYSGKTDENTKKLMSETISEKIREKCKPKSTENKTVLSDFDSNFELLPLTNSQEDNLITDIMSDTDGVDDILKSINMPPNVFNSSYVQNRTMCQLPFPMISYCNNVTINYNILPK